MTSRERFLLSKWYLDCVGEDGSVFLGYSARLRWNLLRVRRTVWRISNDPAICSDRAR